MLSKKYVLALLLIAALVVFNNWYTDKEHVYIIYNVEHGKILNEVDYNTATGYPRRIIMERRGKQNYALSVNNSETVCFKPLSTKEICLEEIADLNVISIDSIFKLLPFLGYANTPNDNIEFHVVEVANGTVTLYGVEPILIEYDFSITK
ncbi:hypothetical protein [Formosa sp. S-31]|uniref:hypothetical protein n=1 Tax=Formosa sp. S-31 TaxID=2790949 RepID=UPI003EBF0891